jgi:hypothetical protein
VHLGGENIGFLKQGDIRLRIVIQYLIDYFEKPHGFDPPVSSNSGTSPQSTLKAQRDHWPQLRISFTTKDTKSAKTP